MDERSTRDPDCVLCRLLPYGACDWHALGGEGPLSSAVGETRTLAIVGKDNGPPRAPGERAPRSS